MIANIEISEKTFKIDFSKPLDISIPLHSEGPRAWYVDKLKIEPVRTDQFTGSVKEGGSVNFRNIFFNPHGHGTHTETVGHINEEIISINKTLTQFMFLAKLITVSPIPFAEKAEPFKKHGDLIITKESLASKLKNPLYDALIVRTIPNDIGKLSTNYSNSNPPYFAPDALAFMRDMGIRHLLTDLPSVDREMDGGKLLAHRAFWYSNRNDDRQCTITEFIYVPDEIQDGTYVLNLQIAPFENDATPSKPILYEVI